MAGIHTLQKIDRFFSPHFPDDDPVGPHPQGCPYQRPDGDLVFSLQILSSSFQPHQIGQSPDLQLRIILDHHHSLLDGNIPGQHIQERCLAASCPSADEQIVPCFHQADGDSVGIAGS